MRETQRESQSILAVRIGLAVNILLSGLKTSVGILGHSPALLADGVMSTSDVAYSIVVSIFIRLASKPADDDHPYGHSQLESIGALVVGSFVITTAIAIFWDSLNTVYDFLIGEIEITRASPLTLWIALFTVIIKFGLMLYTQRVGRQTDNLAVIAIAYDHRNDIFSALAVAVGIFLGRMGYLWVDPFAGGLVSLVIFRTGVEILKDSTAELMDTVPGHAISRRVEDLLHEIPAIIRIDEIQAHRFGPYLVINLMICVDGSLSVSEGDQIATQAEQLLIQNIDYLRRVHVHYHPPDPQDQ